MKQWTINEFSLSPDQVAYRESVDGSEEVLIWDYEDAAYRATFRQGMLQSVNIIWLSSHPTGKDILTCFGTPDVYQAYTNVGYGPPYLEVSLWYPSVGIVGRSMHSPDKEIPPVNAQLPMTSLTLVKPGTLREVVDRAQRYPNEATQNWLLSLRPWPGSWQEVEVVDFAPVE